MRRGRLDGSAEHITYRGILELEEYILRLEEEQKGSTAGKPWNELKPLLTQGVSDFFSKNLKCHLRN